jgi:hypothetical protein
VRHPPIRRTVCVAQYKESAMTNAFKPVASIFVPLIAALALSACAHKMGGSAHDGSDPYRGTAAHAPPSDGSGATAKRGGCCDGMTDEKKAMMQDKMGAMMKDGMKKGEMSCPCCAGTMKMESMKKMDKMDGGKKPGACCD